MTIASPFAKRQAHLNLLPVRLNVWLIIKRLALGLALIALTSSVLLVSDLKSRRSARAAAAANPPSGKKIFQIALLQQASQAILEEGVHGAIDGLKEKGFADGDNLAIRRFNAEGDMSTANAIAKDITDGKYDLVLTMSTLSMQAVANANRAGKTRHVFGLVSDPYGAGVGISRENHLEHPPAMAGYGTLQPVEACFRLARELYPGLKTVGVVWNPAESNSEAQLKLARKICQELGIQLLEATVDNSSGVLDAANAVTSRGADALWVPGDVAVLTAVQSMVQAGKKGRIPVFTVVPPLAERGALFDLGANYYEVGKLTGGLAAEILHGRDPATIPIDNVLPETLVINKLALGDLKDPWRLSDAVLQRAATVIDETGKRQKHPAAEPAVTSGKATAALSRQWKIYVIEVIRE
ncbi:MAG: ABC transporter substrate-binding protein [Limisphaerales bacterium]